MTYQVLARKWRPQVFDDVVGQEHISDVLKNSIRSGRIHHGYIFTGIRGIGKTTTARILAKALNCEHGPTPEPCNACEFCREITEGYSMDVEEIDGASNRGVDDVRVLQENTNYAPSRSRYKIFIIDEVHMLTTEAFNALLKTLEEPPPNIVFLMATTEPWKIPATILSRCQQFTFKPGSAEQLLALLQKIARHEQIAISDESLALLVKSAGGSVRDVENLLDQVIGFCGDTVPDEDVRYVLGIPDLEILWDTCRALFAHESSQIFGLMERVVSRGYNLRLFCMELMERIRNMIVLKVASRPDPYLGLFDYTRIELERYAAQTTLSELQQMYWLLTSVERQMKYSPKPGYLLEIALAKMAHVQALDPLENIAEQLAQLQAELAQPIQTIELHEDFSEPDASTVKATKSTLSHGELQTLWNDVVDTVKERRPSLAPRLKSANPLQLTQSELTLGYHPDLRFASSALKVPTHMELLTQILYEQLGRRLRVVTTIDETATSGDAIRRIHEKNLSSLPQPERTPQEARPAAAASSSSSSDKNRQRSSYKGNKDGKEGWQHRGAAPQRYKAPVQVSVNDIIRLFEGKIEA